MKGSVLLAAWTILSGPMLHESVRAQAVAESPAGASLDEKIRRVLLQERKGVVVMDAVLTRRDELLGTSVPCRRLEMTFGGKVEGQMLKRTLMTSSLGGFGGIAPVPVGEYFVLSVACKDTGTSNYNGPHARFQVRAGEIVNVGTLRIHYQADGAFQRTGNAHRSTEDLSPQVMAFLKQHAPQSATKMVKRRMTMIGAADQRGEFKRCGLLGCI
jgi:hypothetical protein